MSNLIRRYVAGAVGNVPAGNIAATNVQGAINELDVEKVSVSGLAAATGAAGVGTTAGGAGAVLRSLDQKVGNLPVNADDYASVTALFSTAGERTSRRVIEFGKTLKPIGQTLTIENSGVNADVGLLVRGAGFNHSSQQGSSGLDGTGLNAPLINFNGTTAENNDSETLLEDFALVGAAGPVVAGGLQDGIAGRSTDLTANRLLVQYMNRHGVNLDLSFSSKILGGLLFGNFGSGVNLTNAVNRFALRDVRAFKNGRSFATADQANIFMFGNGNTGYGSVIENCDVSYSGFVAWSYAAASLTSVVVNAGVCTVTTAAAHGRATGNFIGIKETGSALLDSRLAKSITVTSPTTFTFPTFAANGNYVAPATSIGPHSNGIQAIGCDGLRVDGLYCENPTGMAAYFGNCKSLTLNGGFVLFGTVYVDAGCEGVEIGGIKFQGIGGLETNEINQRSTINVKSSNIFSDGAAWTHGSFYMLDGVRYGPSVPTTGTWKVGEFLFNSQAGVGDPLGWKCVAEGTPGVFARMGVTGHAFMPQQLNSGAATVADVVNDLNALLAKLKAANLMSA